MDYRTGWNDAQITIVLALLKYREELLSKGAAKGFDSRILQTIESVVDGATAIVVELEPKNAE